MEKLTKIPIIYNIMMILSVVGKQIMFGIMVSMSISYYFGFYNENAIFFMICSLFSSVVISAVLLQICAEIKHKNETKINKIREKKVKEEIEQILKFADKIKEKPDESD